MNREIVAIYIEGRMKHINEDKGRRSEMLQQMTRTVSLAF